MKLSAKVTAACATSAPGPNSQLADAVAAVVLVLDAPYSSVSNTSVGYGSVLVAAVGGHIDATSSVS